MAAEYYLSSSLRAWRPNAPRIPTVAAIRRAVIRPETIREVTQRLGQPSPRAIELLGQLQVIFNDHESQDWSIACEGTAKHMKKDLAHWARFIAHSGAEVLRLLSDLLHVPRLAYKRDGVSIAELIVCVGERPAVFRRRHLRRLPTCGIVADIVRGVTREGAQEHDVVEAIVTGE